MVRLLGHRQTKGTATDNIEPNTTAPHLDSTDSVEKLGFANDPDIREEFRLILRASYGAG